MPDTFFLTEEERLLQRTVREFAGRELAPRAAELDEREQFHWQNVKGLASLGLFGLTIDPKYGGTGGGYRQLAVVIEEIAKACPSTAVTYIAHLSLATQTVHTFGTEGQKRHYVPPCARGEKLAAFCLSEPSTGSDAAAIQTTATKKGDGSYVLSGTKNFITNGHVGDILMVFASEDRSLRTRGVSCFVVEKGSRGLTTQPMHGKMGMRSSDTAQVFLENVVVPGENLIGEERGGFKVAMAILDSSRISIAAQAVGIAQGAFEAALAYAKQRQTFGKPIAEHQAIQFMLADMATRTDAARLLTLRAATLKDSGQPYIAESSMAKLYASETAMWSADRAVQIHGGYGYFKPNPVERFFRDAKVTEIYEGTSEVQRLIIARQLLR